VKLEGEHTFPVSREHLWLALLDPSLLARVLPGCEPLVPIDTDPEHPSWKAAITVAIGPVKGRFQGTLALTDLVPPTSYHQKLDGSGAPGFLRGEGGVELIEAGGSTILRYAVEAQVGGKIASLGQRLVESSGRSISKQGLEGLERELAHRAAADVKSAAPTPIPQDAPPSQAAFAGRVARGVWAELPASWRWGILLGLAALVAAVVYLLR
jgi:carbon monoxide dehydrogenase subunit G